MMTIPRRSFLGLLLATPVALTATPQRCFRPRRFHIAICGWNGGLDELLAVMLDDLVGKEAGISITEHTFVQPLLDQAARSGWPPFDLFIAFFNPNLCASRNWNPPPGPADLDLLTRLRTRCGHPPLVIHNGCAGYTVRQFRQAGAGAVLPMPFSITDFAGAVNVCLGIAA
jgi:hypothetical protein